MAAVVADRVLVELQAKIDAYNRNIDAAHANFSRRMDQTRSEGARTMRDLESTFQSGSSRIAIALGTIGGALAIDKVRQYADAWNRGENQLRAAGVATEDLATRQEELFQIAQRSRVGIAETINLYQRLKIATDALGTSEEDVLQLTETITKALKASGASTAEVASSITQLAQGLASGVLQGDELRSLRENAPLVAQAIAREFNTTIGGLKELGAQGELTSERIIKALLGVRDQVEETFSRTTATIGDSFTRLDNEIAKFIGQADNASGATTVISGAINLLADNLGILATALSVVALRAGGQFVANVVAGKNALTQKAVEAVRSRVAMLGEARATAEAAAAEIAAARASQQMAAARVIETQAARAQLVAQIQLLEAQRAEQLAYFELQRGIAAATGATAQLTVAQENLTATTRALILTRRALATTTAEVAAAENGMVAAQARSTAAATANAAAIAGLTLRARAASASLTVLRGVLNFFGGPIGAAFTAASIGLYALVTASTEAERVQELLNEASEGYSRVVDTDVVPSVNTLIGKYNELTAAKRAAALVDIQEQQRAARDALRANAEQIRGIISDLRREVGIRVGTIGEEAGILQLEGAAEEVEQALTGMLRPFMEQAPGFEDQAAELFDRLVSLARQADGEARDAIMALANGISVVSGTAEEWQEKLIRLAAEEAAARGDTEALKNVLALLPPTFSQVASAARTTAVDIGIFTTATLDAQAAARGLALSGQAQIDSMRREAQAYRQGEAAIAAFNREQEVDRERRDAITQAQKEGLSVLEQIRRGNDAAAAAGERFDAIEADRERRRGSRGGGGGGRAAQKELNQQAEALANLEREIALNDELIAAHSRGEAVLQTIRAAYEAQAEARRLNLEAGTAEYEKFIADSERLAQQAAQLTLLDEGEQLRQDVATPQERRNELLERYNELLQAGAISYETYTRAVDRANEATDATATAITGVAEAIGEGIKQAKTFEEALTNIGFRLLELAAQGLFGQGPLGGLFNNLFGVASGGLAGLFGGSSTPAVGAGLSNVQGLGVGRATGGSVWRNRLYKVGEKGAEYFVPNVNGRIIPNDVLRRSESRDGKFIATIYVNGARGNTEIMEMVLAGSQEAYRRAMRDMPGQYTEHQLRYG